MTTAKSGRDAVVVSAVFTALAGMIVLTRLYTRYFIVKHFPIEEYLVTFSMLCSIGLTITIAIQVHNGMGKHIEDIDPNKVQSSLKAFWASLIVYNSSLGLTKTSIVLQYRRIFPLKVIQIACWVLLGVIIVYTMWTLGGSIFACVPIHGFWTKDPNAKCINQFAMWFANAGINIATDFAIIILPLPVIKSLNLPRRQKQGLIVIFAIGGFVCIVSILRLQSLIAISNSDDPTYDNPPAATWSSVEANVGIICSCLPCLRPLMARVLPGVFSTNQRSNGAASGQDPKTGRRRHWTPSTMLSPVSASFPRSQTRSQNRDSSSPQNIQIVTEFRVHVEDEDDVEKAGRELKRIRSGGSTETLVTNTNQSK